MALDNHIKTRTLVIEIGTEELPPKQLPLLESGLTTNFGQELAKYQLTFSSIESFSTPRRLAIKVLDLCEKAPDFTQERLGPQISQAFTTDGLPTKAGLGFARSCGVDINALTKKTTANGEVLAFTAIIVGKPSIELIPTMFTHALENLALGKSMRWGTLTETFVRPVHWLLALFGKELVDLTLFGIKANSYTYGHRFHYPSAIHIKQANHYPELLLNSGMVIPNSTQRQALIQQEILLTAAANGGKAQLDPDLLLTVTGLVEYPVVLLATFAKSFLLLPKEVLISAMQTHQKCFAITEQQHHGQLLNKFILISNIKSSNPSTVITGNERVMHARLADAEFYYQQDKQQPLENTIEKLKTVVFQQQLGSIYDKTSRIEKLALVIAEKIGAKSTDVARAACLCKTDLLSLMVAEFPELQGIMGYYYARHHGETKEVATAIREQYLPKNALDHLPHTSTGICLALADRIDTLVGFFAIGKTPTGEKDPFGLRRQALGILRILIEKSLRLDLRFLFEIAAKNYHLTLQSMHFIPALIDFCLERLRSFMLDKGIPTKTFNAVLAKKPTDAFDFYCRIQAILAFQELPAAVGLSEANKRVQNILHKANLTTTDLSINKTLLLESAEQELFLALIKVEAAIYPLLELADYTNILTTLTTLKPAIDTFFEKVMVLTNDMPLQQNRILLLTKLHTLFFTVADISLL